MSWFERRQREAEAQAEKQAAAMAAAAAADADERAAARQAAAALSARTNSVPATQLTPSSVARVLSCDGEHADVELCGRRLTLDLRFPAEELEPIFSGGTWAGSVVWAASLALCDFIHEAASQESASGLGFKSLPSMRGKRVLELGAGVGLPGLAAHLCGADTVLLTEQPPLDALLQRTVAEHFANAYQGGQLAAATLDWAAPDTIKALSAQGWEVILCSDCVYEPLYGEAWRLLDKVLQQLTSDSPLDCVVLCAVERRKADGVEKFVAQLGTWAADIALLRRLQLPARWWEVEIGDDTDTANSRLSSSLGVVEVYAIRRHVSGCKITQDQDQHNLDNISASSSVDDGILFS